MSQIVPFQNNLNAMSSTEIAALTGKQKKIVHRDIKEQILFGLYGITDGTDMYHVDIKGISFTFDERKYINEIHLDREHTLTLVTGYDVKSRHLINKRWLELESSATSADLPDFNDPASAARAWADEFEAKNAALKTIESQNQQLKLKDDFILVSNEASIKAGEILIREFVKSQDLIHIGEKKFYKWMRENNIISKTNEPYQRFVKAGFFTYKPSEEKFGGDFRYTLRVTPRGKIWLAAKYMEYLDAVEYSISNNNKEIIA